ncbi:MAG: 50S ribosomal protein L21 [Candidatus Wildermuthbacteria bacterium RIFCSPHIGHO2_01_FULL_48_25]|uniref:Large ribosomal subunit protein bL21 n=1 Tax=Candidatus Wildermuthbacteria bacterium RIFCSPLOWO2_01_FULL_48_16 TaxID=1802461 RepID=A0A1G2RND3_9BACT|nr:MAG: 50S ribosomal protein L21 [Candidatus Wildermuthbacteria bacterium RIFCSPHIGHO2_01_FULL_48_25]OHA68115.1 MAG: 50S ribosomal protein L21 [Candidatus Wildermuthbacteria bacterium RIFCSPHIGHO2_02_FULL_49_12b]OHA73792.1 MAG: 50S ribosomal protein L21 [Candidatus Wildermuthbacteria bacterium RIFCSPLOWO2_01_FULL_48_16]
MAQFAVIKTGGKQYIVTPGQKLKIEKLPQEDGKEVLFEEVLLVEGEKDLQLGTPFVKGVSVKGKVLRQGKRKKLVVFKFKNKSNEQKKKKGHRQLFTEVEITSIS